MRLRPRLRGNTCHYERLFILPLWRVAFPGECGCLTYDDTALPGFRGFTTETPP